MKPPPKVSPTYLKNRKQNWKKGKTSAHKHGSFQEFIRSKSVTGGPASHPSPCTQAHQCKKLRRCSRHAPLESFPLKKLQQRPLLLSQLLWLRTVAYSCAKGNQPLPSREQGRHPQFGRGEIICSFQQVNTECGPSMLQETLFFLTFPGMREAPHPKPSQHQLEIWDSEQTHKYKSETL